MYLQNLFAKRILQGVIIF